MQGKDARTIAILSEHLSDVIAQSVIEDPHKLSAALKPVIIPAISEGIANNKEQMIDALYPIMGGMISKYVTHAIKEMMEKINEKIEQGLSVERYKRKIKAKLTGVSESELLIEESSDATIKSIFVIQKETGLLIAEAHQEHSGIDDPHIVASMASAIKDFVNDWISTHAESDSKEVQLLSYGDATLYIESAGSVYLIAFLDAEPDYEQRSRINAFFAKMLQQFSSFFQHFDGDDTAPEIAQIEEIIQSFLSDGQNHATPPQKNNEKNPAKYILLMFALILLAFAGYRLMKSYQLYSLAQQASSFVGHKVSIEEKNGKLMLRGYLPSLKEYDAVEKFVKEKSHRKLLNEIYIDPSSLVQTNVHNMTLLKQQMVQGDQNMSSKFIGIQEKVDSLQKTLNETRTTMKKVLENMQGVHTKLDNAKKTIRVKKIAIAKLRERFGNNPFFQKEDGSLDFKNSGLFEAGGTSPSKVPLENLSADMKKYIVTLMDDPDIRPFIKDFVIEGYTDTSGNHALNQKLSTVRAEAIRTYLLSLPFAQKYGLENLLLSKGMAELHPVLKNGVEDKEASRRIKIRFVLDKKKILEKLEEEL